LKDNHYAVLGVGPNVGAAEIRRAYRRLALRHHPDRAGDGATATFQRIAEAYRVLSDPAARSRYDSGLRAAHTRATSVGNPFDSPFDAPPFDPFRDDDLDRRPGDPFGAARAAHRRARAAAARTAPLIVRLSGRLDDLVARAAARTRPGGAIDLLLRPEEADAGGAVAIELPMIVTCPTCGGLATRGQLWCRRCEFEGTIVDNVTLCLTIPPFVADGVRFRVEGDPFGGTPPLSVCIRRV
jgi:DnaJ-class molecular chaperone